MFSFAKYRSFLISLNAFRSLTPKCTSVNFCSNMVPEESIERQADIVEDADRFGNLQFPLEKRAVAKLRSKKSPLVKERDTYSNKFGTLSKTTIIPVDLSEEPAEVDDSTAQYPDRKYRSPEAYLKQMMMLVKERKLKDALELFPDMKKHGVTPIHPNFTFMIGACGRAGYTEMAFQLLKQMTVRKYRPSPATLTGLFNSCAECPFPEYGLKKTHYLREKVVQKNWLLTQPTYHAMIKSFGRCGDLLTAFEVVDEMIASGITVDTVTYNFLLMSCISDKEAGFTHAVEVWRKMLIKKMWPDLSTFNLLLRAARDCNVGPQEISCLLLQHWSSFTRRPYGFNTKSSLPITQTLRLQNPEFLPRIESKKKTNAEIDKSFEFAGKTSTKSNEEMIKNDRATPRVDPSDNVKDSLQVIPNILATRPMGETVFQDLLSIQSASDRLALIGNAAGFLDIMRHFKTEPDIKTFSLILECLPSDIESEHHLLDLMGMYKTKPDVDFFNLLVKRRNYRKDYREAKNVLLLINKHNLTPDVVTFGVLALGCPNIRYAVSLLRDMEKLGSCPNIEILGALIRNATMRFDFNYLEVMLNKMKLVHVRPNEKVLKMIESVVEKTRQIIIDKERGKEVQNRFISDQFDEEFQNFCDFYSEWLRDIPVETDSHPWDQFKTDIIYRKEDCKKVML